MGPTIFNVVCVKLRTMYIIYLLCSSLSELNHLIAQKIEKKKKKKLNQIIINKNNMRHRGIVKS